MVVTRYTVIDSTTSLASTRDDIEAIQVTRVQTVAGADQVVAGAGAEAEDLHKLPLLQVLRA